MKHVLFKVKDGKENAWRKWCSYLCAHEAESKETMRTENCLYERSIIYERNGDYYVVSTVLFDGEPIKADLNVPINEMHHKAKDECLGGAIGVFVGEFLTPQKFETLYEFNLGHE